jgi:hypothetical protein
VERWRYLKAIEFPSVQSVQIISTFSVNAWRNCFAEAQKRELVLYHWRPVCCQKMSPAADY